MMSVSVEEKRLDTIDVALMGLMGFSPWFFPLILGIYAIRHSETAAELYLASERYVKGGRFIENPSMVGLLPAMSGKSRYEIPEKALPDVSHKHIIAMQRKIQSGHAPIVGDLSQLTTTHPQHLDVIGESGTGKTVLVEMIRHAMEVRYGDQLDQWLIDPKNDDEWGVPSLCQNRAEAAQAIIEVAESLQATTSKSWKLIIIDELQWIMKDYPEVMDAIEILATVGRAKRCVLVIMRQSSTDILDGN